MVDNELHHHQYYQHQHYYHPDYDHYHDVVSEEDPESSQDDDDDEDDDNDDDDDDDQQYEQSIDDSTQQTSENSGSTDWDDWHSERSDEDVMGVLEEVEDIEEEFELENSQIDDNESLHNTDLPSSSSSSVDSEPNNEEEEDDDNDNDDGESEEIGTLPTDTWSKHQVTRGYLTSTSRVPPRVSPVIMTDEERGAFFDLANQHLAYQASVREEEFAKTLYDIAEYYDFVRGKWLLFIPANVADLVWHAICEANNRGDLGGYCECYPYDRNTDSFRIAVFCNNFAHFDDCIQVLHALRVLLAPFMIQVTTFKPDFLSALGVYKQRRRDRAIVCRFTFRELNIADSWLLPQLKLALILTRKQLLYRGDGMNAKRNGARKRTRRRRRRRKGSNIGNVTQTPYWPEQSNPFQTNKMYNPSRPNSRWTSRELRECQLVHYSDYAPNVAHRTPRNMDAFLDTAKRKLSRWMQTVPTDREHRRRFMAQLYTLAKSADFRIGKWKVFAPARVADGLWAAVCRSNARGRLGGCVKICQYNPRSGAFLVCVYVNDFTAVDECIRVLHELERICAPFGVSVVANFKADFLTKLGIYHSRNGRTSVQYTFGELRVARDWPYPPLKSALDEVKRARRRR